MGHGLQHNTSPLQESTNASPMSLNTTLVHSLNDVVAAAEKYNYDYERLRNNKRLSRSVTVGGIRQAPKPSLYRLSNYDQIPSKKKEIEDSENTLTLTSTSNKTISEGQSFWEMLNSGPSRSPSPVRPPSLEHDEANNPTLTNWSFLIQQTNNRYNDSMSELATILEHEAMNFTSTSGSPIDYDRRASEPDMSHRGILDCIDSMEQVPTDSDSQHSSSDGSRGVVESLHSLPKDELLQQQRVTKEEKKRLRRALKELEMQFEARAGRRMQKEDRGTQVNIIYDSYKQAKAKLRLISALLAKNT